jgi:hypothetical protein
MLIVLGRHLPKLADRPDVERAALASIRVNMALASASTGGRRGLLRAALQILALGPAGMHRYLRDSRIVERLLPRVRARMTGTM